MKNCKAFTIVELLIAITLIGILSAAAVPAAKKMRESHQLNSSALGIKATLERAKSEAIKNQAGVNVTFATGTGTSAIYRASTSSKVICEGHVAKNVTIDQVDFSGTATVTFNSLGMASYSSGDVRLVNSSQTTYKRIRVEDAGCILVESSTDGSSWSG